MHLLQVIRHLLALRRRQHGTYISNQLRNAP
jgi:hypothetical protein